MNPQYLPEISHKTLLLFILIPLAFTAGYISSNLSSKSIQPGYALRANAAGYKFVSPLLACQEDSNSTLVEFKTLKDKILRLTKASTEAGQIIQSSIYFRDPYKGRWFGINEYANYAPASLLKVPLMMAYLKQAETDPSMLKKVFFYKKNLASASPLIETPLLKDNTQYAALELIQAMIIDSDNNAKDLLKNTVNPDILSKTYTELGIESPYNESNRAVPEYHISAKTYALFFRVLYNATFLSRDMSEKALDMLSDTKFAKGIRAGIPPSIHIAHKYGVHVSQEDGEQIVELSDCGIVYNANRPYLLCLMTKGKNPNELAAYITSIAATIQSSINNEQIENL